MISDLQSILDGDDNDALISQLAGAASGPAETSFVQLKIEEK